MGYVPRPPDANKFTPLNSDKFYGAANAVPHPHAGSELTNCMWKNLTANSKDDPILDVASAFPLEQKFETFMDATGMKSFPVKSKFPTLMRAAYMNCVTPDRQQVSERNGTSKLGTEDLLRGWAAIRQRRAAEVALKGQNVLFGSTDLYENARELSNK